MNEAILKQYDGLKAQYPDAIILFRCGDFYETFQEDAKVCARELGITLTRSIKHDIYSAGFPHHALDAYLPRLVRAGHRIAICDPIDGKEV